MSEPAGAVAPYPVSFEVAYSERQSRWKAFLRLFLAIPVLIFVAILAGANGGPGEIGDRNQQVGISASTSVILAIWITIILRQNIPRWLFDFWVAVQRFVARAIAYLLLLTDQYPPFEGDHAVRYEVVYPDRLSRWRVFIWKLITSVPHFIVLFFLGLSLTVVTFIAWLAVLVTATYPKGLHEYTAGVLRWGARVYAYAISLTDEFPPFSLSSDAGAASRQSCVISAVAGVIALIVIGGGLTALALNAADERVVHVSYDDLLSGSVLGDDRQVFGFNLAIVLTAAEDPAGDAFPFLEAKDGHRLIAFTMFIGTDDDREVTLRESHFKLKDDDGKTRDAFLALADGRTLPVELKNENVRVDLVFELDDDVDTRELRYDRDDPFQKDIVYRFE